MRRLIAAILLTLSPVSALAIQESGGATKCCGTWGYKEQEVIFTPKNDSGGASHDGKCYTTAEISAVLASHPTIVLTDTSGIGNPSYMVYGTKEVYPGYYASGGADYTPDTPAHAATWHDHVEALAPGSYDNFTTGLRFDLYRKLSICIGGAKNGWQCNDSKDPSLCASPGVCTEVHAQNPVGTFDDTWILHNPSFMAAYPLAAEWPGGLLTNKKAGASPAWGATHVALGAIPYGDANRADDSVYWTGYFVVDVTNSAYQDWFAAQAVQAMRVAHSLNIDIGSKIGWWEPSTTHRSGGCGGGLYAIPGGTVAGYEGWPRNGRCANGTLCTNTGATATCSDASTCDFSQCPESNPLTPTPFASGAYADALNATILKIYAYMDTHGKCSASTTGAHAPWDACTTNSDCTTGGTCELFTTSKVFLGERPDYQDKKHVLMAPVMRSVHYGGELSNNTPSPGCAGPCTTVGGVTNCACPDLATGSACPL